MSIHYRAAEKLLYTYPVNLMHWHEAVKEYMRICGETDCHGQSYEQSQDTGDHSDPPCDYVARKQKAEQEIKKYGGLTRGISLLRQELRGSNDERLGVMLQVMELYYFEGMSMKDLAMHLRKNERTLYRRREELVKEVMKLSNF